MRQKLATLVVSIFTVSGLYFVAAPSVIAADSFELFPNTCERVGDSEVCGPCNDNKDTTLCKDSQSNENPIYGPTGIIATIVNILSIIIGVAAVIIIIIAGIQYMLSTGDPSKVNNAKNAIIYAVVGLIIAVSSQIIVRFVISRIG